MLNTINKKMKKNKKKGIGTIGCLNLIILFVAMGFFVKFIMDKQNESLKKSDLSNNYYNNLYYKL